MAIPREIIKVGSYKDGKVPVTDINQALRRLSEMIYALEGRTGEVWLRDDLTVSGGLTLINGNDTISIQVTNGELQYSLNGGNYKALLNFKGLILPPVDLDDRMLFFGLVT